MTMTLTPSQAANSRLHRRVPRSQRGSAFIAALLALVVLTIVGLSLALITQTEMQIGANERVVQKVFYAADAGIAASVARAMVNADYTSGISEFADKDGLGALLNMRHEVDSSPFYPILEAPCNLCSINNAGQYGAQNYSRVNHAVTAVARRTAGDGSTRLAETTLSAMVDVQPWRMAPESLLPLTDSVELAKIKF